MLVNIKPYLKSIPKGVIHVGGNAGEEQVLYDELKIQNVIWIEAIKESAEYIERKFKARENILVLNECISDDIKPCHFNITNNLASSSLLDLGTHKTEHPKIKVAKTITVHPVKLSSLIKIGTIDINKYDMMNIDVQGAELKVLKSMEEYLEKMKYVYVEVNIKELYVGCPMLDQIDSFLKDYDRVNTVMTKHGWGDALFVRKN